MKKIVLKRNKSNDSYPEEMLELLENIDQSNEVINELQSVIEDLEERIFSLERKTGFYP